MDTHSYNTINNGVSGIRTTDRTDPTSCPATSETVTCESHSRDLLTGLNLLRGCNKFTDVILCVGQEEFPCHKALLASSSPYFQAMFSGPYLEQRDSRVVIEHISPWTMKRILEFVYTGRVEVSVTNVQDLLEAAGLLEYPTLVTACDRFMRRRLEVSNCLGVELLADLYGLEELRQAARRFAIEHFAQVVQESGEWVGLPLPVVVSYLACDEIDVRSEEIVWRACMAWVAHDSDRREKHLPAILAHVRLNFLSGDFLRRELEQETLLKESPESCEIVRRFVAAGNPDPVSEEQGTSTSATTTTSRGPRPSTLKQEMVLVIGGINSYILNCTERFHPGKATWFPCAQMPVDSLTWFSASVVSNMIIVTGGIKEGRIHGGVYRFSPETNTWSTGRAMLTPRARHASVTVAGSHLFVLGGVTTQLPHSIQEQPIIAWGEEGEGGAGAVVHYVHTIERYDPRTDTWSVAGTTAQPRKESVVVQVEEAESRNGRRFIGERTLVEVGGLSCVDNSISDQLAIYRVQLDLSVVATSDYIKLARPIRYAKCAVGQLGTLLYILWEETGELAVLNLPRNSLHYLARLPTSTPRIHCGMALVQQKLYLVGGFRDVHTSHTSSPCPDIHCYDPQEDKWTAIDTVNSTTPRAVFACLALQI